LKSPGAQRASGDFASGSGCQRETIDRHPAPRHPDKPRREHQRHGRAERPCRRHTRPV